MENQGTLEYIICCIEATGKDPRTQIYGFVTTGNECYITRHGDASALIKTVDASTIAEFISRQNP